MARAELSRATIGRLPSYLRFVQELPPETDCISAAAIARGLALGEVQVRKDLSAVCGTGKPRVGYDRGTLCACLEAALGVHTECEAVIVGAGRLGLALLDSGSFAEYGISLSRAFDREPSEDERVLPVESLHSYCMLHQVEIGVITVPPQAAQEVADSLIRAGVRAIWCFAPVQLRVPPGVAVQYEDLALSLAHLHQKVSHIANQSIKEDRHGNQGKTHR